MSSALTTKIFIGRKKELALLQGLAQTRKASLVAIYGRRRIGKSRLVEEFASDTRFIRFSGTPPTKGRSAQDERDIFMQQFSEQFQFPRGKFESWADIFTLLASMTTMQRVIILLDEISWIGSKDRS